MIDNTKAQSETLEMSKRLEKLKETLFVRASCEKHNDQGKVLETTTEILPSTLFNAATTKMAEKYNKPNGKTPKTSRNSLLEHFS